LFQNPKRGQIVLDLLKAVEDGLPIIGSALDQEDQNRENGHGMGLFECEPDNPHDSPLPFPSLALVRLLGCCSSIANQSVERPWQPPEHRSIGLRRWMTGKWVAHGLSSGLTGFKNLLVGSHYERKFFSRVDLRSPIQA